MIKNIFDKAVTEEIIDRINKLNANTQPLWGKMAVGQMMAHCCVTYEYVYDNIHKAPNGFLKLILKLLISLTYKFNIIYFFQFVNYFFHFF